MTTEELAYIAGIIDGEGSMGLYSRNPSAKGDGHYITLQVAVVNTSKVLIDWLKKTVGKGGSSIKAGPDTKHKEIYVWQVSSKQAIEFLRMIRPWLIVKAPQADVILELAGLEAVAGTRQGTKPTKELQEARVEAAMKVKALKLVA